MAEARNIVYNIGLPISFQNQFALEVLMGELPNNHICIFRSVSLGVEFGIRVRIVEISN